MSVLMPVFIVFAATISVITGKVIGISDGDTIKILTEDKQELRIRLNGIDCPEKKQAFGTKARQFTSDMVFGKTVSVRYKSKDRYGRILGDVILNDSINLNYELVRAGYAWWYRQYAKKDTVLEQLENEARIAKRGLWADKNPVAPWEYRKMKRTKSTSKGTP